MGRRSGLLERQRAEVNHRELDFYGAVSREVWYRLSRRVKGGSEEVGPEMVSSDSPGRSRAGRLSKVEVEIQ